MVIEYKRYSRATISRCSFHYHFLQYDYINYSLVSLVHITIRYIFSIRSGCYIARHQTPTAVKRPMTLSSFLCVADKENISNSTTNKLVYYGTKSNYANEKYKLTVCKKFWEVSTRMMHNMRRTRVYRG